MTKRGRSGSRRRPTGSPLVKGRDQEVGHASRQRVELGRFACLIKRLYERRVPCCGRSLLNLDGTDAKRWSTRRNEWKQTEGVERKYVGGGLEKDSVAKPASDVPLTESEYPGPKTECPHADPPCLSFPCINCMHARCLDDKTSDSPFHAYRARH